MLKGMWKSYAKLASASTGQCSIGQGVIFLSMLSDEMKIFEKITVFLKWFKKTKNISQVYLYHGNFCICLASSAAVRV